MTIPPGQFGLPAACQISPSPLEGEPTASLLQVRCTRKHRCPQSLLPAKCTPTQVPCILDHSLPSLATAAKSTAVLHAGIDHTWVERMHNCDITCNRFAHVSSAGWYGNVSWSIPQALGEAEISQNVASVCMQWCDDPT